MAGEKKSRVAFDACQLASARPLVDARAGALAGLGAEGSACVGVGVGVGTGACGTELPGAPSPPSDADRCDAEGDGFVWAGVMLSLLTDEVRAERRVMLPRIVRISSMLWTPSAGLGFFSLM